MKYIITENQLDKFLSKYCDRLIHYPEFKWINNIDINKTTTDSIGWANRISKPLYLFTVYIKPGYPVSVSESDKRKIFNQISRIHSTLFPVTDLSDPETYFTVDFDFVHQ
jgi:hypothetical protein